MIMKIYGLFKKRLGYYDKYGKWVRKKILISGIMCVFCFFSFLFMFFYIIFMIFDLLELGIFFLGFTRFFVLNFFLCYFCI